MSDEGNVFVIAGQSKQQYVTIGLPLDKPVLRIDFSSFVMYVRIKNLAVFILELRPVKKTIT